MDLVFLALYFLVMIGIGLAYQARQTTVSEFITANHGLGYWVATFSARTTGESGWLLLGLTGAGFAVGLPAMWVVVGEVVGVIVSWFFIIPKFKAEVTHYKSLTMLDYFEDKLEDRRHILRYIFAVVLLVMVTAYIAAQLTATGKAFHSFYQIDMVYAQILGLAIILIYITLGGFRAVAISDFIQGILMLIGLVAVPIVGIVKAGGISAVWQHLAANHAQLLSWWPEGGSFWVIGLAVLALAGPGLGFLGSPQVYQRIIALKKEENLRRAGGIAVLYTFLTDAGAVLAGMVGRYYFDSLADVETVYPQLVETLFPPMLVGFFLATILSAVMSTADSLLILAATTLIRDVYQKVFRPQLPQKRAVLYLRITTVIMSVVALLVAAMEIRLVFWFALFGWAGIACSFCPPLILTLFWRKTNRYGVMAGAIGGFLTAIIWKITLGEVIYEMIPGFVISFVLTFAVSLLTARKTQS